MTLADWAEETTDRLRRDGWRGVEKSAYELYKGAIRRYGEHATYGHPIYEADWDVLVVLDGCRVDLMTSVADEFAFVDDVGRFQSLGTRSDEWMVKNFREKYASEMRETVHITANPNSADHVDAADFRELDEVWRDDWDEERGTVPPRAVTDRAIRVARERDPERLLLHYMQPHFPSIPEPLPGGGIDRESFGRRVGVWERMRVGELSKSEVWNAYQENLRYVLDDVELLLDNVDARRVVLTADHGNAFGERGIYGHPDRTPLRCLTDVPWVVTTATDHGAYEPERTTSTPTDASVDERLAALGYR